MSKLDGNERWKSKFILGEHVEQYNQERQTKPAQPVTNEEIEIALDAILHKHMIEMMEKYIGEVNATVRNKFLQHLLSSALNLLLQSISTHWNEVKRNMRQRNISMKEEESEDFVIYYRIYARGYNERFGMTRDIMRARIGVKLGQYAVQVFRDNK
ncbi:MAG: hypothetical protein J7639_19455 [Paenibacillaceae bacterium]|nr:hypothetical protein [Paenibacillaceae bacterium]